MPDWVMALALRARKNSLNILAWSWAGMPMPVSCTDRKACWPRRPTCTCTLPPAGVYLMALLIRFPATSWIPSRSPITGAASVARVRDTPFSWAHGVNSW